MADISKITLPSGTTYDIKDAVARQAIAGGVKFLGVSDTEITDHGSENPRIDGHVVEQSIGDIVIFNSSEFIWAETVGGGEWNLFGDLSMLGDLAYKDTASGSVAVPKTYTTTVTPSTTTKYVAGSATGGGSASKGTVTVSKASSGTATYTPAGTNASSSVSGSCTVTPSGTISKGSGTANYTPQGSVSTPTITVTPSTTTKYVASSATGGGSVTAGSAASFTATVSGETLSLGWTANTPTAVTLPSFSSQTIATGISSASSTQPTFTGTGAELKFTGSSSTGTISGTAAAQTFTGTGARLVTDSQVYTSVTMPSFDSQTIVTGVSSAGTTTATTENKTVTVS